MTGCSVVNPDELPPLDFRGEWVLHAVHQQEPDLSVQYLFTLSQNEDHTFEAIASQFVIDRLVSTPRDVTGSVTFEDDRLRLEFGFEPFDSEPEVAVFEYRRASNSSSLVAIDGISYLGVSIGIILPSGAITGYDTEAVFMEQLSSES